MNGCFSNTMCLPMLLLLGCSSASQNKKSVPACLGLNLSAQQSNSHEREQSPLELTPTSNSNTPGLQVMHGYIDVEWLADGQPKQKRCVLAWMPAVDDTKHRQQIRLSGVCLQRRHSLSRCADLGGSGVKVGHFDFLQSLRR